MMKYTMILSLLMLAGLGHAQTQTATNSTASETATNAVLLENAAKSRELLKQSGYQPTKNKFLQGSTPEAQASAKSNLTDQEKQLVDNYVDQAGANKIIKEKCVGEMKQACAGSEVDHKVMGMSPTLIKLAARAYATIGAMGDIGSLNKGDGVGIFGKKNEANKPTPDKDASKKAEDWCKYIPAMTETIATYQQQSNIQKIDSQIDNGGETSQKENLLKAAKSHDSRAELAQIQAVGWYGGAACYAYKASTGDFAVDTNLVVKLGAATLLGTFYQEEVSANKDYAQKTRDIANSLPGKGQCNPITENACYCAEEEHKNDPRYCQAQINARAASAAQFSRVACVDNQMKLDQSCVCDRSNSCFDKVIENQAGVEMQFGIGYSNSPFKSVASLARGKLENGSINNGGYAQTAAIAKKALVELANKIPSGNAPLTLEQKEIYDAAVSKGLPPNAARLMAQNPPPASAVEAAKSKLANLGSASSKLASISSNKNSSILDFSGGNGLGVGGKKDSGKKDGVEDLLGSLKPGAKSNTPNSRILEFAQKAEQRAAQVSKADRPIFEIISLRYQTSGRRLLQLDPASPTPGN